MSSSKKNVFIRESSGLVKQFGAKDAAGKILTLVLPLAAYYTLLYAPGVPGADNFGISALVGILFAIPPFYMYLRMSELIPRSSGEYIYISRFLHPMLGIIQGLTNIITVPLLAAFTTIELTVIAGFAPMLQLIGIASGNMSLITLGSSIISNPLYLFAVSAIFTIIFGIIISLHNRYMSYIVVISMVLGQIIGPIVVAAIFLLGGQHLFSVSFQDFSAKFGLETSYATIYEEGIPLVSPPNVIGTLVFAILLWIWEYSWFFGPSYFAGEYKGGKESIRKGMITGWILAIAFVALLSYAAEYAIGLPFFDYAALNGWGNLPISFGEGFVVWAGIMVFNQPILLYVIAITGFLAELAISIVLLSLSTRVALAMSFDRLLPEKLSFTTRSGAPIFSSVLITLISLAWVYAQTLGGFAITSIGILSILMLYQMLPAVISGALLGKKKKLISIDDKDSKKLFVMGIIAAIDIIVSVGIALGYGYVNSVYASIVYAGNALYTNLLLILLPLVGIAYYEFAKRMREKQGVDISILFNELPPE